MSKKNRKIHILLFTALLCTPGIIIAQFDNLHEPWRWTHFTVQTGLPSNSIEDVVEADNGTVWVLTQKGIAWYDGFRWHAVDTAEGLPDIQPNKLIAAHNGQIMVLINRFLYKGDTSGFSLVFPQGDSLYGKILSASIFDDSTLIVSTTDGENYLLKDNTITANGIPAFARISHFWHGRSNSLWFLSDSGIIWRKKDRWLNMAPDHSARSISENSSGDGLMSVESPIHKIGIWEWTSFGPIRHSVTERGQPIRSLDISSSGNAIAVYQSNVIRIRENGVWNFLRSVPQQMLNVQMVKFRHNDDLWVGTESGLFLYRKTSPQWSLWQYPFSDDRNNVMEIFQSRNGDIWIGNTDGVVVHPRNGREYRITAIDGKPLRLITGINEDAEGAIWICSGSAFQGAYRWDGRRWKHFGTAQGLTAPRVHKIRKDRSGNLWFLGLGVTFESVETDPGAFVLENGTFRSVSMKDGLVNNRVYAFAQSKSGALWFGTKRGLSRYHDGVWKHWQFQDYLSNFISSLAIDDNERVWFSNFTSRLGVIENNDSVQWFVKTELFGNRRIWDVQVDENNTIWIASERGLFSVNDQHWSSYNVEAGSGLRELRRVLPLKEKVYVGGHGVGVGILDRRALNYPIKISIEKPVVESNTAIVRWSADALWGEIASEQIEVRFRINNSAWSQWVKKNETTCRDLSDGTHVFEIQAKDIYNNIRDDIFRTTIVVPAPFYKKTEFLLPLTMLSTVSIFLLVRNIRAKIQHTKAIQNQRLRIANDLHDEIGSNLGSIALIGQRIARDKSIGKAVKQELQIISDTAIQTADYLRDIVWYTNPRYDDMMNLEIRLRETAARMLMNFDVQFLTDDSVKNDSGLIVIRRSILLMFKEILHNVVKHSKATKVVIRFERQPDYFKLSVTDNGRGFNQNNNVYGNGLHSLHKRAAELQAKLEIQSHPETGTTVEIVFANNVDT